MPDAATTDDVRYAYRLLLGREPDAAGWEHFSDVVTRNPIAPAELAKLFMSSPEYRTKHRILDEPVLVNMGGYEIYVRAGDRDIGHAIAAGHSYEPHVTSTIRTELTQGAVFLDVGANIGYFTAMAASIVGSTGRVIAIEPMDKNLQLIYATVSRNGFDHVEVWPFAASSRPLIASVVTDPGTSNALLQVVPSSRRPTLFAYAQPLDRLLPGLSRLDLMKMDAEGHEPLVWDGFREGLARCRPKIITEFHPLALRTNTGADPAAYLDRLFGYAQAVYVIQDDGARTPCRDQHDVMQQWDAADARRQSHGTTHLDLFIDPRS